MLRYEKESEEKEVRKMCDWKKAIITGFLFETVVFWLSSALMLLVPPQDMIFYIAMWAITAIVAYLLGKIFLHREEI